MFSCQLIHHHHPMNHHLKIPDHLKLFKVILIESLLFFHGMVRRIELDIAEENNIRLGDTTMIKASSHHPYHRGKNPLESRYRYPSRF